MMPPLITVGSKPPASSRAATIEVVVVLPWVPPIATQRLSRISSASISARRTTGRRLARAEMLAEIDQHLRNAAHADAADTDEVDRTDVARQFHRGFLSIVATTRSASRSAASIAPCERAAAAIATS